MMKKIFNKINIVLLVGLSLVFIQCADDDDNMNVLNLATCTDGVQNGDETGIDCGGAACEPCAVSNELDFSGTYAQEDQMGRPATNTVFSILGMEQEFNVTVPSEMQAKFKDSIQSKLLMLNSAYTENVLGQNADAFATFLSRDVLWVAQTGDTDYANLLGRRPEDDVMDSLLLWIYGGPDGTDNDGVDPDEPLLITDNVDANDGTFSTTFPYLAEPFTN